MVFFHLSFNFLNSLVFTLPSSVKLIFGCCVYLNVFPIVLLISLTNLFGAFLLNQSVYSTLQMVIVTLHCTCRICLWKPIIVLKKFFIKEQAVFPYPYSDPCIPLQMYLFFGMWYIFKCSKWVILEGLLCNLKAFIFFEHWKLIYLMPFCGYDCLSIQVCFLWPLSYILYWNIIL